MYLVVMKYHLELVEIIISLKLSTFLRYQALRVIAEGVEGLVSVEE